MSKKDFNQLIKKFGKSLDIKKFYDLGGTSEQMKEFIFTTLSPFYRNSNFIKKNTLLCVPEAIAITRHLDNPLYLQPFKDCLKIYNSAKDINPQETFLACANWNSLIERGISRFWSIIYLHDELDVSEIYDKAFNFFEIIKTTIEGLIQPFLRCLLALIKIIQGTKSDFIQINNKSLGLIVKEILDSNNLKNILEPQPFNIRINQWRNIAAHDASWSIRIDKILCEYGTQKKRKNFTISIKELEKMANRFIYTFYLLKTSYNIFTGDNLEDITKLIPEETHRPELRVSRFVGALLIQGLEVKELKYDSNIAMMKIDDLSYEDPFENRLISFQLLIGLWKTTKSQSLNIEYWKNNEKYITIQCEAEHCEKASYEQINFTEFSDKVNILFMKK